MLRIQKQAKINFDNEELKISTNELSDFLLASVSEQIILEEEVLMSDIMNISFHLKSFIKSYFIEEYEALNSLVSSGVMIDPITKIIVYKEMVLSPHGEMIIVPKIRTENLGDAKMGYFDVEVEIDNKLTIIDDYGVIDKSRSIYSHFTLLEFLGAIFEDFQDFITRSSGVH